MDTIPKGTIITCPRKRDHVIGVLIRPVWSDYPLKFAAIEFEAGQFRIQGELPHCRRCGAEYAIDGKVHTASGWRPSDPVMPPVKPHKEFKQGQIKARANPNTIEKQQAKELKKVRDKKKKDKDKGKDKT